ncbi:MAG: hypothetical protein K6G34_14445 [Lachnospiraceae bacterium]|nr:hypothetical protein [Lachnospiraceae bacterium]
MWIRDFWNRVLAKFRKEENSSVPVMELKAEEAPEPVPERKTSDEMIIEMAQSAVEPEVMPEEPRAEAEPEVVPEEPRAEAEPEVMPEEPKAEAEPETEMEQEAEEDEREYFEEC